MKLLQISPFTAIPPPQGGGSSRVHGLMTGKGETDEVVRFAQGSLLGDEEHGWTTIDENYREYTSRNYLQSVHSYVMHGIKSPPLLSDKILPISLTRELKNLANGVDLIVVEYPWQFPYVNKIKEDDVPIVYSSHDYEPEVYSHLDNSIHTKPLYRRIQRLERIAAERADLIVVTSERDRGIYDDKMDITDKIYVAPNAAFKHDSKGPGDDSKGSGDVKVPDGDFRAIFVGSNHHPNRVAVDHIIDIADDAGSAVQFLVVGTVCDYFSSSDTPDNLHLMGFVDSLESVYDASDVALNPITTGGGTNTKIPEYFSHRIPVVTTPFGARGIPAEDGNQLFVRELNEIADTLVGIKQGAIDAEATVEPSYELFIDQLNWEAVSEALFGVFRQQFT